MTTIVAECGIEHNGDIHRAKNLVLQAKDAGADLIKFQLFTGEARPRGKKYIFSEKHWREIKAIDSDKIFWSVFDFESVYMAKEFGASVIKLSFVERRNSNLISRINKVGFAKKIISIDLWGQYNDEELADWIKLYCPNNGWSGYYPTLPEHIEWEKYVSMASKSGLGWSCHCSDFMTAVLAAGFGAATIEKHFKIDEKGPDSKIAILPDEFATMVKLIRTIDDRGKR